MTKHRTWRDEARPLVAQAIASGRASGLEGRALYLHVNRSFPWGERGYHPYKIWQSEARFQLELKTPKQAAKGDKSTPLFGD
jgi:hypothetical protein